MLIIMKTAKPSRNKLWYYFLFGIVLPCLLLGYLAFRGIQNDRALEEKQLRNKHASIASAAVQAFHEHVSSVEQTCRDSLLTLPRTSDPSVVEVVSKLKDRYRAIEEIFWLSPSSEPTPAANHLVATHSNNTGVDGNEATTASRWFRAGQQMEFQQNNLSDALTAYTRALRAATEPNARGHILSAIARVQRKLTRVAEAISTYEKIARDYAEVTGSGGFPLGLAAKLEMTKLYLASQDTLAAAEMLLQTYENILQQAGTIQFAQYQFFGRQIHQVGKSIFAHTHPNLVAHHKPWQRLQKSENALLHRIGRWHAFQQANTTADLLSSRLQEIGAAGPSHRSTFELGSDHYLVSLLSAPEKPTEITWGILWCTDVLKSSLLPSLLGERLHSQDLAWRCVDQNGQLIAGTLDDRSGGLTVKTSFVDYFPPWSLEMYHVPSSGWQRILASRRSLYVYIFLLIAGILFVGLILTVRSVSRELELAKLKSDFVSTISHEFRSPLTSIRQLAEMLQRGRVPSKERQQKYYDVLVEQSERLSLLINNVLDFAKMEEGRRQFNFEPVEVTTFLNDVIATLQPRLRHEAFHIEKHIDGSGTRVSVDRLAMAEVLMNLVDNAIKYSHDQKKIQISSFTTDNQVVIRVHDFGIGIKKDEQAKVFDRFFRGSDGISKGASGSGLGLTLVKHIIEGHKGSITVDSEVSKGSTFTIRLPKA